MLKEKKIIEVPYGTRYISELKGYKIPNGEHCIVDKGLTGCGYTELCLTSSDDLVLCSPRKLLLENKKAQHAQDLNILYLESGVNITKEVVQNHISWCRVNKKPCKFMITYDSTPRLLDFLGEMRDNFIFIIDEFQSIFLDSYFKVEIESYFLERLQGCKNVVYLSATPFLDKYLVQLDEFKDLQYYKLDWSKSGCSERIKVYRKNTRGSLVTECNKIIKKYLEGDFPKKVDPQTGNIVESKEAVFYFNSIHDILSCLKNNSKTLKPENTIIVCADDPKNVARLKKRGFTVSKIPLKGEPNPMFMFCTKTVYVGIDMYSDCASTYVFANPNIENLALDISLDLPQIMGRQRSEKNLFKSQVTIFYKLVKEDRKITREEFDKRQEEKFKASNDVLTNWNNINPEARETWTRKLIADVELNNYSKDFIGISKVTKSPVINKLIVLGDQRAWEASQEDYQDEISVSRALSKLGYDIDKYTEENQKIVGEFLDDFYKTGIFEDRMKKYCEFMTKWKDNKDIIFPAQVGVKEEMFEEYFKFYGLEGCKAANFKEANLKAGFKENVIFNTTNINQVVYSEFKVGDKLTRKEIKEKLKKIYQQFGVKKSATAEDIGRWFETERNRPKVNGKYVEGLKLIKKK